MQSELNEEAVKFLSTAPETLRYAAELLWDDHNPYTSQQVHRIADELEALLPLLEAESDKKKAPAGSNP